MLQAYVCLAFWDWFALPLGAPAVAFWHLFGLRFGVRLFLGHRDTDLSHLDTTYAKFDAEHRPLIRLLSGALFALVAWAVGAIIHGLAF